MRTIKSWSTTRLLQSLPHVTAELRMRMQQELRARGILGAIVVGHLERRRIGV